MAGSFEGYVFDGILKRKWILKCKQPEGCSTGIYGRMGFSPFECREVGEGVYIKKIVKWKQLEGYSNG